MQQIDWINHPSLFHIAMTLPYAYNIDTSLFIDTYIKNDSFICHRYIIESQRYHRYIIESLIITFPLLPPMIPKRRQNERTLGGSPQGSQRDPIEMSHWSSKPIFVVNSEGKRAMSIGFYTRTWLKSPCSSILGLDKVRYH